MADGGENTEGRGGASGALHPLYTLILIEKMSNKQSISQPDYFPKLT